jgi:phosphoribosylanthranilate isomerase
MTKIKICGLRRMEDIRAVNEAKPDFAGFILEFPKSFRSITKETLRTLVQELDPAILPVGVFVNAPIDLPEALLKEGTIAMAQLHGSESEAYIRELKERTGAPVVKAFSVKSAEDIERALICPADYILLDQGGGGTGKVFDWNLVPRISRPWFLAGGLGRENLREAAAQLHPWAVDLSSSLETDRYKDPAKIREAVELIRGLDETVEE